jgi:RecB family endonuclease NucS
MQTNFRGKTITREDMLKAMKVFDDERRSSFPEKRWVTYAIKHEDKLYPPKETFRIAADTDDVPPGGPAVNDHFERLGFEVIRLDSAGNDGTETIGSEEAIETSLSLESDLEKFLLAHLTELEPGLRRYQENGNSSQQVSVEAAGRIDILAVDKDNAIVVIEIKAGEADDRVCGQILRYMGWVKEKLAGDRKVRGIIVANDFSERLRLAARVMPNVILMKYEVSFKFKSV